MSRYVPALRRLPALVGLLLLCALGQAFAQCDCVDKADLRKRIKLAEVAAKEFALAMVSYGTTPYTTAEGDKISGQVGQAMFNKAGSTFTMKLNSHGKTNNLCQIDIEAPTPCLKEAIRRHEQVHEKACKRAWAEAGAGVISKGGDRFVAVGATMADFCREEVEGYTAELKWMAQELARLESICKEKPPPPLTRDYSSRNTGSSAISPMTPITPPPIAKPRPMPTPTPIRK